MVILFDTLLHWLSEIGYVAYCTPVAAHGSVAYMDVGEGRKHGAVSFATPCPAPPQVHTTPRPTEDYRIMPSQMYDIYFSGQIMDGKDPLQARQQIGSMFKANQGQLDQLFSGKRIRIKSGVDEDAATKYRVAFRNTGALVEIRPSNRGEQQPSASSPANSSTSEAPEGLILLPANTGSLEECAPRITPQQLPDISHISLASAGTILDESPDPEPPEIDTDSLSLGLANTGTLEEYKKDVEPYPIPDINHLDLDQS